MKDRQLLVLLVEPELQLAAYFQLDLTQHGHRVNLVLSAEHALKVLTPEYDVIVTDLRLPEMTGERLILAIRAHDAFVNMPVLVIANDKKLPPQLRDRATRLRPKPFDLESFTEYVEAAAGPGRARN